MQKQLSSSKKRLMIDKFFCEWYIVQTNILVAKQWLGANASKSSRSEQTVFWCSLFANTQHVVGRKSSWSVTDLFPKTPYIAFLQFLTNRSHTPPTKGVAGALTLHLTALLNLIFFITAVFHAATRFAIARSAPTKLVPLSLIIGLPLGNILHKCIDNYFVWRGYWVYMYDSQTTNVRQVNRNHHISFIRKMF